MSHASIARRPVAMSPAEAREIARRAAMVLWRIRDAERRVYRAPTVAPTGTLAARQDREARAAKTSATSSPAARRTVGLVEHKMITNY